MSKFLLLYGWEKANRSRSEFRNRKPGEIEAPGTAVPGWSVQAKERETFLQNSRQDGWCFAKTWGEPELEPPFRAGVPLLYNHGTLTLAGEWQGRGLQGETCAEGACTKAGEVCFGRGKTNVT